MRRVLVLVLAGGFLSCHSSPGMISTPLTAATMDTRFHVAEDMRAAVEMQISGEPFAQLLGRNIAGYDRFSRVPDLYTDPTSGDTTVDPLSYSLAVESYEYSKQPMNNLSFESGAGLALAYGPVENPMNVSGADAVTLLRKRFQTFAEESHAGGPAGVAFVTDPPPLNNPLNIYGWPGYWPVFAEFRSFDPHIMPMGGATHGCTLQAGYAASTLGAQTVGDYECGYISLNLPSRDAQVEKVLEPAALGYAAWKQALWVINYWQSMHDIAGNGITTVADADLPQVGQLGNTVVGQYPDPNDPTGQRTLPGMAGVYLGDNDLEGWQGLTMLEELQNKAALLLTRLTTSDGSRLGGFASTKEAIGYGYSSPLRWWPDAVAVTETGGTTPAAGSAWKFFPQPSAFQVNDASSHLEDLSALDGGFGELFALTDANNPDVGGQASERATFDGDPFPADNGMPDGEDTPHDRSLAILKVATVDMDRLHFDPDHQVLVDTAMVTSGGAVSRGTKVTTLTAAYAILGLRTAMRAIGSSLTLYSNDTPDQLGAATALDGAPLAGAPAPLPERMVQLVRAEGDFMLAKLVATDGAVSNGYDLAAGAADPTPTTLEAEAGAIRGLLEVYLATSDNKYREGAIRVYGDLQRRFWMSDARAFRTVAGVSDGIAWTPAAYGTLEGALRQYWKLVAHRPGQEAQAASLLDELVRTNKLVLNGWDDRNGDNKVDYPSECTGAGLQMGERALTGELSHPADNGDRDQDCVKEISTVGLPSALAAEVVIHRK